MKRLLLALSLAVLGFLALGGKTIYIPPSASGSGAMLPGMSGTSGDETTLAAIAQMRRILAPPPYPRVYVSNAYSGASKGSAATLTGATTNTLTDTGIGWTVDEHRSDYVQLSGASCPAAVRGIMRRIAENTADTLQLYHDLPATPDTNCDYEIFGFVNTDRDMPVGHDSNTGAAPYEPVRTLGRVGEMLRAAGCGLEVIFDSADATWTGTDFGPGLYEIPGDCASRDQISFYLRASDPSPEGHIIFDGTGADLPWCDWNDTGDGSGGYAVFHYNEVGASAEEIGWLVIENLGVANCGDDGFDTTGEARMLALNTSCNSIFGGGNQCYTAHGESVLYVVNAEIHQSGPDGTAVYDGSYDNIGILFNSKIQMEGTTTGFVGGYQGGFVAYGNTVLFSDQQSGGNEVKWNPDADSSVEYGHMTFVRNLFAGDGVNVFKWTATSALSLNKTAILRGFQNSYVGMARVWYAQIAADDPSNTYQIYDRCSLADELPGNASYLRFDSDPELGNLQIDTRLFAFDDGESVAQFDMENTNYSTPTAALADAAFDGDPPPMDPDTFFVDSVELGSGDLIAWDTDATSPGTAEFTELVASRAPTGGTDATIVDATLGFTDDQYNGEKVVVDCTGATNPFGPVTREIQDVDGTTETLTIRGTDGGAAFEEDVTTDCTYSIVESRATRITRGGCATGKPCRNVCDESFTMEMPSYPPGAPLQPGEQICFLPWFTGTNELCRFRLNPDGDQNLGWVP